jgi:phosphomannomutase
MDDFDFDDMAAFDAPTAADDVLGEELAGLRRELLALEVPPRHAAASLDRWADEYAQLPSGRTAAQLAHAWGNLQAVLVDAGGDSDDGGWGRVRRAAALGLQGLLGRPEWASLHTEFAEEVLPLLADAGARPRAARVRRMREAAMRLAALARHAAGTPHAWRLARLVSMAYPHYRGGWMGRYGREVTPARLIAMTHALLDTLGAGPDRPVVIGYDSRVHADELAALLAETALGRGVPVHLAATAVPTPALLHYQREALGGQAAGVLMCTASRRPVRDPVTGQYTGHPWQGVRAYGADGLPVADPMVSMRAMQTLLEPRLPWAVSADVTMIDPTDAYLVHTLHALGHPVHTRDGAVSAREALRAYWTRPGARIVVDGLHGAARGCLERVCAELALPVEAVHAAPDPLFGALIAADPVPGNLEALSRAVKAARDGAGPRIGIAFDADGDRFGVVDEHGALLTPDAVAALCADFLLTEGYRGVPGAVLRTREAGHALSRVTAQHQERVLPHPVAPESAYHRYAGEVSAPEAAEAFATLPEGLLLAADAGGIAIGPERVFDGVRAALLVLTLCAVRRGPAGRLWRRLQARIGAGHGESAVLSVPARVAVAVVNRWLDDYERPGMPSLAGCTVRGVGGERDVLAEFFLVDSDGQPAYLLLRADPEGPQVCVYAEAIAAQRRQRLLATVRERVEVALHEAVRRADSLWSMVDLLVEVPVEGGPIWRFLGTLADHVYARLQELARPGQEAPALLRLLTERLRAVSPERAAALAVAGYPVAAVPRPAPPIPHVHWEPDDR